jgi:Zn-dependent protease
MFKFTFNEVRDLIVSFIIISLAFSIIYSGQNVDLVSYLLPMVMIGVGLGFILHEIAHKLVSMHYKYWAEYKLWMPGLIIALVGSLVGFIFAAPGAVYIYGNYMSDRENGIISLAGPVTNIFLGLIFLILAILFSTPTGVEFVNNQSLFEAIIITCTLGFSINGWLAVFNLIPFSILDGAKIFRWDPIIWLVTIAIGGIMVYISFTGGIDTIIGLFSGNHLGIL